MALSWQARPGVFRSQLKRRRTFLQKEIAREKKTLLSIYDEVGHQYHEAVWMVGLMLDQMRAEARWTHQLERELARRARALYPQFAEGLPKGNCTLQQRIRNMLKKNKGYNAENAEGRSMGPARKAEQNPGVVAWPSNAMRARLAGAILLGTLVFGLPAEAQQERPTAQEMIAAIQAHVGVPWKTATV